MTDDADDFLLALRREYLAEAPARLGELRKDLAALRVGEEGAEQSLRTRFHRLAGSGGSYGFLDVTEIAREAEHWLVDHPAADPLDTEPLSDAISRLTEVFDREGQALGMGHRGLTGSPSDHASHAFGWLAMAVGSPSLALERASEILEAVGFLTRIIDQVPAPDEIPFSTRPDVVVLVPEEPEGVVPILDEWNRAGHAGLRSVILIDPSGTADRLHAATHGVDRIIPAASLDVLLPRLAKEVARLAALPLRVLVVAGDDRRGARLSATLEKSDLRASRTRGTAGAFEALDQDLYDLAVLDEMPMREAFPFARTLRSSATERLRTIPLLWLPPEGEGDRSPAIAAGLDELSPVGDLDSLVPLVRARAERGRAVRALAHRDDLTGLLSAVAFDAELEQALIYARRHKEPLTMVVVDIDHLKRINERHAPSGGDEVLRHVGRVLLATVRRSDLAGRLGGEEFGLALRRCPIEMAERAADKIRLAVRDAPATLAGAGEITVHVSAGVAVFPDHAERPAALVEAADRALARAKASGRHRIAIAPPTDA